MSTISLVMTVMVPGARGTTPSLATVHISDTMPMLELVDLALWGHHMAGSLCVDLMGLEPPNSWH